MGRRKERTADAEEAAGDGDDRQHLILRAGGNVVLLHSDAERREFISAGAAAGLAVRVLCLTCIALLSA
jgi:hypothetical protein